jgi:hypothetical protein
VAELEPVPPHLSVYAAALTVALTTDDEDERVGAVKAMADIIGDDVERVTNRRRYEKNGKPDALGDLIRYVLDDRLEPGRKE